MAQINVIAMVAMWLLSVASVYMLLSGEYTASAGFSIAAVTVPTWKHLK